MSLYENLAYEYLFWVKLNPVLHKYDPIEREWRKIDISDHTPLTLEVYGKQVSPGAYIEVL